MLFSFFLRSFFLYIAPNRVMIGCFNAIIYPTIKQFKALACHDMIYAKKHTISVIRNAYSTPTFNERIIQAFAYHTMSIGQRGIIKIATHKNIFMS